MRPPQRDEARTELGTRCGVGAVAECLRGERLDGCQCILHAMIDFIDQQIVQRFPTRNLVAMRTAKASPMPSIAMPIAAVSRNERTAGATSVFSAMPVAEIHPVRSEWTNAVSSGTPSSEVVRAWPSLR